MTSPTLHYHSATAFSVHIPGRNTQGHEVVIPLSVAGLNVLKEILRHRQEAKAPPTIGSRGAPPQADVDALVAAFNSKTREAAPKKESSASALPVFDLSTLGL